MQVLLARKCSLAPPRHENVKREHNSPGRAPGLLLWFDRAGRYSKARQLPRCSSASATRRMASMKAAVR